MNTKISSLLIASVLTIVLLANLMSATITFTSVPSLARNASSANIIIQSDRNETVTFSGLAGITEPGKIITFTIPSSVVLTENTPKNFTLNYNIPSDFKFLLGGTYSTTLTATGTNSSAVTQTLSFEKLDFCSVGEKGDLVLDVNIDHVSGFGTKDDEWYPEDEIKLTVNVDNQGDNKIQDIIIGWGLYNPKTGRWVVDDEETKFDLKSGKDLTKEITFKVNADDLDSNTESYILYVKAYSDDVGENTECVSDSQDITVTIESDFVILNNIKINPTAVSCGSEIQLTADVWNIGDDDQDDVYVRIYNPEFKIDRKVTIGSVDSLDNKKLNTNIQIPDGLTEKTYDLQLEVYDTNDDVYINSDDDESRDIFSFKVEGCALTPQALITANLQSGGQAGKELVIKSTIKNIGTTSATYTISTTGYESWATLSGVQPATITLNANEQKDVLINLNVNNDVSGDQTLNIIVATGTTDKEKLTQPVAITIQKSGGFSLPGISGFAVSNNWYLWGIGILNVVLVIIIIVVAMRIARS